MRWTERFAANEGVAFRHCKRFMISPVSGPMMRIQWRSRRERL